MGDFIRKGRPKGIVNPECVYVGFDESENHRKCGENKGGMSTV